MIVIVVNAAPAKLRGHLTRWLFEISPGVYVGKVSARVRDHLWEQVLGTIGKGSATLVYPTNNEQGMDFKIHGHDWTPIDFDGLKLIVKPADNQKHGKQSKRKNGWSNASRYRFAR